VSRNTSEYSSAMRRALLGVMAAALILAGCGSSSSGAPSNPLASTLSYFPSGSPFVLSADTGKTSQTPVAIRNLEQKLPQIGFVEAALMAKLKQLGINYQTDIHPLFGNPIVFGDDSTSFTDFGQHFLVAWVTRDAGKLNFLLHKIHGLHKVGSHDGATLYAGASSGALAVNGPTVVFARTEGDLVTALDRHQHNQGITSAQYASATAGLDPNAAGHIFGDLTTALSTPGAAKARLVPWVGALRSYAITLGSNSTGVTFGFRFNTDPRSVSASQLPIASGSSPPGLVNGLPIQVGVRDPAQIVAFALGAVKAASPKDYAKFLKDVAVVRRKTGVDVNKLLGELSGDLVVDSDTHTTLVRAGLSDPAAVTALLRKLASVRGGLGQGKTLRAVSGGVYSVADSHRTEVLGVVGDQLIFGVPPKGGGMSATTLRSFASAPAAPAAGANGAVSFRVSLSELIALETKNTQSPIARQILGLLGDLTGSMSATTGALSGTATLGFK
jgi:hypothetical protein